VNKGDLAAKAGQEKGFLASRVAASDNDDFHIAVKGSIAGRAGRNALASKHFLSPGIPSRRGEAPVDMMTDLALNSSELERTV